MSGFEWFLDIRCTTGENLPELVAHQFTEEYFGEQFPDAIWGAVDV